MSNPDEPQRVQCGGWTLAGVRCKRTRLGDPSETWYCNHLHKTQASTGIYRLQCENRPHCYLVAEFQGLNRFLAAIAERNEHYGCCSTCSPRTEDPKPPEAFMAELQTLVATKGTYDTMMSNLREKFGVT